VILLVDSGVSIGALLGETRGGAAAHARLLGEAAARGRRRLAREGEGGLGKRRRRRRGRVGREL
jgi:hypothetical protein